MSGPEVKPENREVPVPPDAANHPVFRGHNFGIMTAEAPRFPSKEKGGNPGLEARLKSMGLKYEPTVGQYDEPEHSYIIHGPTLKQMQDLGRDFGQESVIHSQGGRHQLHYVNGPNAGHYIQGHDKNPISYFGARPDNFWTALPGHGFFRLNLDPEWKLVPTIETILEAANPLKRSEDLGKSARPPKRIDPNHPKFKEWSAIKGQHDELLRRIKAPGNLSDKSIWGQQVGVLRNIMSKLLNEGAKDTMAGQLVPTRDVNPVPLPQKRSADTSATQGQNPFTYQNPGASVSKDQLPKLQNPSGYVPDVKWKKSESVPILGMNSKTRKSEQMATNYSMADLVKALQERLRKAEADFAELTRRELRKADSHMEPGLHEAALAGAPSHQEPGGHEQFEMNPSAAAPEEPVGSAQGMPPGDLQPSPLAQPGGPGIDPQQGQGASVDPCILCGNPDLPGSCTCLDAQAQQANGNVDLCPTCGNQDAPGSCTCLNKAEKKAEILMKPPVSEAQRRAMGAAAGGNSTLGIPKKVGKEFMDADKGGKLPATKKNDFQTAGEGMAMNETMGATAGAPMEKAAMCKSCGYEHVPGKHGMKKAVDFVNVDGKKKTVGVDPKAKLPPKGADNAGPGLDGDASKEMSPAGSGGEKLDVKKTVEPYRKADLPTVAAAKDARRNTRATIKETKNGPSRSGNYAEGAKKPHLDEMDAEAPRLPHETDNSKAEPPMAKPPSGKNPATMVPTAKPAAPKVGGAPGAKPMGKAALPASPKAQMAQHANIVASAAAAPKAPGAAKPAMPSPEQHAGRAAGFQAAAAGAFQPKGPVSSGLELAPKKPAGMANPMKPGFGKSEAASEDLRKSLGNCPFCGGAEHPNDCRNRR